MHTFMSYLLFSSFYNLKKGVHRNIIDKYKIIQLAARLTSLKTSCGDSGEYD